MTKDNTPKNALESETPKVEAAASPDISQGENPQEIATENVAQVMPDPNAEAAREKAARIAAEENRVAEADKEMQARIKNMLDIQKGVDTLDSLHSATQSKIEAKGDAEYKKETAAREELAQKLSDKKKEDIEAAIKSGNLDKVKEIVESSTAAEIAGWKFTDKSQDDANNMKPGLQKGSILHLAIYNGSTKIADYLSSKETFCKPTESGRLINLADILLESKDAENKTPLLFALNESKFEIAGKLLGNEKLAVDDNYFLALKTVLDKDPENIIEKDLNAIHARLSKESESTTQIDPDEVAAARSMVEAKQKLLKKDVVQENETADDKEAEQKKPTGVWGAIKAAFLKFVLNFFLAEDVIRELDSRVIGAIKTKATEISLGKSAITEKEAEVGPQETSVATERLWTERTASKLPSSNKEIDPAAQALTATQPSNNERGSR